MAMKHKGLKQGLNTLNLLLVATFFVLALYSAIGQQIIPYVGKYRLDVERYISEQLNSQVQIRKLSGDMKILTPSVHIEGITMHRQNSLSRAIHTRASSLREKSRPILSIAAVDAVLDPGLSLFNLTPVFKTVRLSGVSLILGKDALINKSSNDEPVDVSSMQRFVESMLLQQHLELNNVSIETWLNGQSQTLQIDHMVMTGDGFNRLMTGSLSYGDEHKIKAGVRIFSQGSPYDLNEFYARGVIDLPNLDVDYWLDQFSDTSIFNEFSASAQLGFEFKEGLLNYAKLSMATPKLSVPNLADFKNINTEIWLKQSNVDTWSLWLEDGQFSFKEKKWQFADVGLKLSKTQQGNRWHSFIKEVDLEYTQTLLKQFEAIPDSIAPLLEGLNARGKISDFSVVLQDSKSEDVNFTVAGKLQKISIDAHGSIPGLSNVNGVLAANQYSGRVQFSGDELKLNFPTIYDEPIDIVQGHGQVDWFIGDEEIRIKGDGLDFSLSDVGAVKGGFQLWMPQGPLYDSTLELNLSFEDAQVSAQTKLVPNMVSDSLREWLDSALHKGQVKDGNLFLYSSLSKENPDAQIELYFDLNKVDVTYLSQWPNVRQASGKLFVSNSDVFARIDSARTLGGELKHTGLAFNTDNDGLGFLWLTSLASGPASEIMSYFQETPLQNIVNHQMDDWQLTGDHKTHLAFKIPLNSPIEGMGVGIQSQLSAAQLSLGNVGLEFTDLSGQLQFSSRQGLSSPGLNAQLWEQKLNAQIDGQLKDGKLLTDIKFNGIADTKGLKDWLKLGLLNGMSGLTPVKGHFIIDSDKKAFTGLKVSSSLKGVELDLPAPLMKSSDESKLFSASLQINQGLLLKLSYDEKVNLAMQFNDGIFSSGQVFLGATEAYIPSSNGLEIQGHVESVNVNDWMDTWAGILSLDKSYGATDKTANNPVKKIVLSSDKIIYDDFIFEYVKSEINIRGDAWHIKVDAPIAKGRVVLNKNKKIDVDLEYLHWPMQADSDSIVESDKNEDPLKDLNPASFPDLNLKIDEVFLGATNYGRWKFKVKPDKDGVKISDIDGEIKKLNVKGDVSWLKGINGSSEQQTRLNLQLTSEDVGGIQKAWHQKPAVESESLLAGLDVNWQASPAQFSIESLTGDVAFHLKDGRFVEAGDTGALSAFGLLNFSAIGRRLRLDFSDVYQSGLHFDSIKGKTKINNGLVEIVDTLDFVGPAANFSASGSVNLLTKELDQELAVTFPVFSTLPFVAILAGFAPPIAASIFVGEKLVGGEIEKFSSATYKLSGSWEEPELKIMKRFDNEIEGKKDKTFWLRMKDVFGLGGDE